MAGQPSTGPGFFSMAGFDGSFPEAPATFEDVDPASYDARARLAHMDREGIRAATQASAPDGFCEAVSASSRGSRGSSNSSSRGDRDGGCRSGMEPATVSQRLRARHRGGVVVTRARVG